MARGESGRVVLEIDPEFKRELYAALTREGLTLKDWFLASAERHLQDLNQPSLFQPRSIQENPGPKKVKSK